MSHIFELNGHTLLDTHWLCWVHLWMTCGPSSFYLMSTVEWLLLFRAKVIQDSMNPKWIQKKKVVRKQTVLSRKMCTGKPWKRSTWWYNGETAPGFVPQSLVKVSYSCPTLCNPMDCSPWNSPGQITGVGSLSLLQGILPTQGSNPGFPHCRWIHYQLS